MIKGDMIMGKEVTFDYSKTARVYFRRRSEKYEGWCECAKEDADLQNRELV